MAKTKLPLVTRDVYPLSKTYPIDITESFGVSPLYERLHWHDLLEINYIKSGTGYYNINGQIVEFRQGDIILINSNDLHRAYEREGLHIQVFSFDRSWLLFDQRYDPLILLPFTHMGVYFANLLDRAHPRMDVLRLILHEMEEEHKHKQTSYVSVVRSLLLRFLALVGREFRLPEGAEESPKTDKIQAKHLEKIREVIAIMEQQYTHPWDLDSLSALVYLSPSRFSAIFKQTVGVSLMEYLIQLRIERAHKLIEESDMKIVDIALECGFRNLSNFNRLFKRHTSISPSEARESKSSKNKIT